MNWEQPFNPLGNIALSAILASVPILFICWALVIRKMKGYIASAATLLIALVIAIAVYGMPAKLAVLSLFMRLPWAGGSLSAKLRILTKPPQDSISQPRAVACQPWPAWNFRNQPRH